MNALELKLRDLETTRTNNLPTLDLTCSEDPSTCDRNSYNKYRWNDLCPYLQEIARDQFGYNESFWDGGYWTPTFTKKWRDLTWEQQRASELFCWGQDVWCSQDPNDCDPQAYGDFEWEDLCDYLQEEAKVLGFDEKSWNVATHVEAQDYDWDELPQSPKNMTKAAVAFCFNETEW
eukprot:CAMPEP_0195508138 /NCGR_PEP_ID=MMETSP0794_2-20130614/1434_1 /TAXON_ID=515487 /ORGANISM="Stephanopyxis turris, Strain CCMP 815" /LENGTH=175 /DNA_ID=CAMNT_0040635025 /DNA_START=519 /DNA_END=1043 /DNA_ORIENTATION=+